MFLIKSLKTDWIYFHSQFLLFGLGVDLLYSRILILPIIGFICFSIYIIDHWKDYTIKKKWGGFPNLVTTFRLLLIFIIPFLSSNFSIAFLASFIVALDLLDGFLARKLNQVTVFGGELDMETDAFFCLLLSLIISLKQPELFWIIIGGSLRYIYKIVTTLFAKINFIESKKVYARYFAGIYYSTFVIYFFLPFHLGKYIISFGNLLVITSFSISFYEFFKYQK